MNTNNKITIQFITRTAILLALSLVFQIGLKGVGQPLVGPLVNFILIISSYLIGTLSGVIIGCLTPLIAFLFGIMPLFPIVPFVMISNSLYVCSFEFFKNKFNKVGEWISIIVSSLIKYAFLALSVRYLVVLFVKVPQKLILAFSLPQLYTALIGGVIAIIIKEFLPKSMFLNYNKN